MNKYEMLKADMVSALKNGDKLKRLTLGDIVATIDKTATSGKTRIDITDVFVDEVLAKYQKTVQEMVDTCPDKKEYAKLKTEYLAKLAIVKEYAPQVVSDKDEIKRLISYWICQDQMIPMDNKGLFMKTMMAECKAAHFDMKIANQVLSELWANKENK